MSEQLPEDPTALLIRSAEAGYFEDGKAGTEDLENTVWDIIWIAGYRRGATFDRIVEEYCHWHNDYYRRLNES